MRWSTDVNGWTSRGAWNRRAKGEVRNAVAFQEVQQRLTFSTVRVQRDVHRVVMVQPPAVMNRALAEDSDRKLAMKRVGKEPLHFPTLHRGSSPDHRGNRMGGASGREK